MPQTLALPPSTRAFVVAMRLWHFERQSWWIRMEPLGARLGQRAGRSLLMALDGLMTVLAEHARCDIELRPVACKRLTAEEHAFVRAVTCAGCGDTAGCRDALSPFLDGKNLEFALSLLHSIAAHLAAFAATVDGPAAAPAAHC
ncbi:hypothetical protein [Azospirillum sp. ST 5-10]|uniref:hypothetical protein n=1 Tax=unclassified Azospirillum TaxID=2630922 RepID=UPI003F49EA27